MIRSTLRLSACLLPALLLAACTTPEPPPAARVSPPKPPVRDLVAQVRAAAEADDALEVAPLRDPQVHDLREEATRLEQAGQFRKAGAAIAQALEISPEDPELLQHAAELAIQRKAWDEAVSLANRSYELGPRLGPLCRRNWAAVQVVREVQGHADAAQVARERGQTCTVERPVRM